MLFRLTAPLEEIMAERNLCVDQVRRNPKAETRPAQRGVSQRHPHGEEQSGGVSRPGYLRTFNSRMKRIFDSRFQKPQSLGRRQGQLPTFRQK
jgi:hypothetical protein